MPCGGIYPCSDPLVVNCPCCVCGKPNCDHYAEEWDTGIHKDCILNFLASEEGQIVVMHKHLIMVGDEVLQNECELNKSLLFPENQVEET